MHITKLRSPNRNTHIKFVSIFLNVANRSIKNLIRSGYLPPGTRKEHTERSEYISLHCMKH